jgi:UPF0716 family protein affecting phage T7 exclusion
MPAATHPGLLEKLLALVAGVILLIVGFMFSVVLLAIVAVAGLVAWSYFWWKTRALRKAMRERPFPDGQVIEGEAVVVDAAESVRVVNAGDIRNE